jgi:ATP-dependent DNA ligase
MDVITAVRSLSLEGIVAKRKDSPPSPASGAPPGRS